MDLAGFLALAGVVVGFAILLPFVQGARRKATLELLQQELRIEREARIAQEERCTKEIARLSGRLDTITSDFAATIALEMVKVLRKEGVIP